MCNKDKCYLTLQDVAARLKVSIRTVKRYIKSGYLRAIRLGGKRGTLRVEEQSYVEYVESHTIHNKNT